MIVETGPTCRDLELLETLARRTTKQTITNYSRFGINPLCGRTPFLIHCVEVFVRWPFMVRFSEGAPRRAVLKV